jgi:hypothetical protein
MYSAEPPHE